MFIQSKVYNKCNFEISNYTLEKESKEYDACRFQLNGLNVISRSAKITPSKVGQFVTFWKRLNDGPIEPFRDTDLIDFLVVNVQTENESGQFVFPIYTLVHKGILSTPSKEGKRAFRVYPSWDFPKSKQAERTQKWQLEYFYKIDGAINFNKVSELYKR